MNVLILHYHLNPGGVTKVIESQVKAIKNTSENHHIKVICGNSNDRKDIEGCLVKANSALNYIDPELSPGQILETTSVITAFLKSYITENTVLHCHNLNLGKNPALTMAVYNLAAAGIPVVNHYHDFAEDRPRNISILERMIPMLTEIPLCKIMYPDFKKYQYVVLNSCDYNRLITLGVQPVKINLMQNPVIFQNLSIKSTSTRDEIFRRLKLNTGKKLCLYPVRAITRKNLGELILLAVLFAEKIQFAVTQPPRNPLEIPQYERWKSFCMKNQIDLKFETGDIINYEDLINISDFCVTTSIQEGFGMAYLEPWLADTPVIGRELSCVIGDLKKMGLQFPRLYKQISVEAGNDYKDFKELTTDQKERLIKKAMTQPVVRDKIMKDNSILALMFDDSSRKVIAANQEVIKNKFSIEQYGKRLLAIYKKIS